VKYVLPYIHAAMCAVLLLSAACGDTSGERGLTDAESHYNRGFDYDESGEYRRAIQEYDRAIELDPNYADAYVNRGVTYDNLGNYIQS